MSTFDAKSGLPPGHGNGEQYSKASAGQPLPESIYQDAHRFRVLADALQKNGCPWIEGDYVPDVAAWLTTREILTGCRMGAEKLSSYAQGALAGRQFGRQQAVRHIGEIIIEALESELCRE